MAKKEIHADSIRLAIWEWAVTVSGKLYDDGTTLIKHSFDWYYGEPPVGHFNVKKWYKIVGARLKEFQKKKHPVWQISLF